MWEVLDNIVGHRLSEILGPSHLQSLPSVASTKVRGSCIFWQEHNCKDTRKKTKSASVYSKVIETTREKMSRQTAKKSLSNSPLYRSTIDHIVREDNVQSVTEDLKVSYTFSAIPFHTILTIFKGSRQRKRIFYSQADRSISVFSRQSSSIST